MDVLSDILGAVKLRGTLYFTTEFSPPWGVRVPPSGRVARFHLVVRGRVWVAAADDDDGDVLEAGDLVLVPHGAGHLLADGPETRCVDVDRVIERSGFDGRGALIWGGPDEGRPTRLVCGHFALDPDVDHPLLEKLPGRIVIRADEHGERSRLDEVFRYVAREAAEGRPGAHAVIARLSEVLFVQALRLWADRAGEERGLLAALADPRLAESLAAIHRNPADRWTLAGLARRAGVSRTGFAERFGRVMGMSPMRYVTFWRMQRARSLLVDTDRSLEELAGEVGYDSAPAFGKAFRRCVGESPGAYRARRRVDQVPAAHGSVATANRTRPRSR